MIAGLGQREQIIVALEATRPVGQSASRSPCPVASSSTRMRSHSGAVRASVASGRSVDESGYTHFTPTYRSVTVLHK